jgi:hypothetical protein
MVRYIKFAQLASTSIKIIFETFSGWRQEGPPLAQIRITGQRQHRALSEEHTVTHWR